MKKTAVVFGGLFFMLLCFWYLDRTTGVITKQLADTDIPAVRIETLELASDKDEDGILDLADIIEGARLEVEARPYYKSAYYQGGYPPDNEGVRTDVIWLM
ncbi:MAG: DUF1287 domain-containing protein [Peptococcaceae bacterium]